VKYAYLKYGNVIEELGIVGPEPQAVSDSGPTTFVQNFLKMVGTQPALLLSYGGHDEVLAKGNVEARTIRKYDGIWRVVTAISVARRFVARLITFKPDVVICVHDGIGLWSAYIACCALGVPLVHSRQRALKSSRDQLRRKTVLRINGMVLRRASAVICHGPFTRSQLLDIGVDDSKIVEYDVKFDESFLKLSHERRTDTDTKGNPRKIAFLGRVEESKGVHDLLDACVPILKDQSDIELVYIGGGEALEELARQVARLGLQSRVTLTGRVPHAEIGRHLAEAVMLVTPTRYGLEGWGMAALEGLALGVPVVAPNAGSFPFMIRDGYNGLLFESDSVEDMRAKIRRLLSEPCLHEKLVNGALEFEAERSNSTVGFGDALRLACDRALASQ
jgi:glycosyltransferase involved in cell wall biosynthesis